MRATVAISSAGSSPLARGLPVTEMDDEVRNRIIPARAGFTRIASSPAWAEPDHPRSRGVYSAYHSHLRGNSGSSPLARGLRDGGAAAG